MKLTTEEAERAAYIAGDVERAALLARIEDGDAESQALAQHWEEEAASQARLADSYAQDEEKERRRAEDAERRIDALKSKILLALGEA